MTPVTWTDLRGLNSADPPTMLGPNGATDAHNVLLEPLSLGRRRPSCETVSLTSGPAAAIYQLVRFQPAASASAAELFAFNQVVGAGAQAIARLASGTWATITESDTIDAYADRPYGVTFNGKCFVAYDSDQNRLHVYDPAVSTTALRRVGIAASAAATVADLGSGSGAAVLRYYKIQWKLKSGSNVIATSELSPSVSITPAGAYTVRVTKPSTPDSATHWVVFGSADNVNYYDLSGDLAVGTGTHDDSVVPSAYSAGAIAPSAGLYVPPPSAKYLLATDNRLFMAGAWESSATSTQTAPRNSRVWFTQVLGSLDNTGEDEAIAQTADLKNWVDVGENDGDAIVGLGGPIDGAIFVFKTRSIWRLSPTGNGDVPYRADRVSSVIGATWQDAVAMGEDGQGNPSLYFMSQTGPKRITNGYGIEDLGADVRSYTSSVYSSVDDTPLLCWDAVRRIMWWLTYGGQSAYAFQPQFEQRTREGVRGGWTRHTLQNGGTTNYCVATYEVSGVPVPFIGGATNTTPYLASLSGTARRDVSATTFTPSVTSGILQPAGGPLRRFYCGPPVLEWDYPGAATAISVSLASAIGGPTTTVGSSSDTTASSTYSEAVIQETLEGVQLGDVTGLQITVTWDTAVDGSERPRIHSVTVPVTPSDRA